RAPRGGCASRSWASEACTATGSSRPRAALCEVCSSARARTLPPGSVCSSTVRWVGRRVVVIDNYDSFVYNLVQYLGELGAEPIVYRHDELDLAGLRRLEPDALL